MEFLEVTARVEFIELLAKVAQMENVTMREQQTALTLIEGWAAEIKAEMKKPHTGARLNGCGLQ